MASAVKTIVFFLGVFLVLIASVYSAPLPGGDHHTKIRIHVPVKHHTHVITKTIVKTVHIPIKKEKKHSEEESWSYSKKKPHYVLPDDDDDYRR